MGVAGLFGHLAGDQPAGRLKVEERDDRFEQGGGDPLALTRRLSLDEGGKDAVGECHPRGKVADRDAYTPGPAPRWPGDAHEAAHSLGDLIDARPGAIR